MTAFPEWVVPMAATLTQERFTGPDWIFERKFDGIRLLAFKQGADVRLFSRNRLPQNIPSVVQAIAALPANDLILDGEATWQVEGSAYHVFDVLWLDGRDVTPLPARSTPRAAEPDCRFTRPCIASRRSTIPRRGSARARRAGRASSRSGATRSTSIAGRRTG